MSLIDVAVEHFNSKPIRSLEVKEWGVTVYAKNATLNDKSSWLKRAENDSTKYMVYAIIFGLVDEKGNALFDVGDKHKLMNHVDPEIVGKLSGFVLETAAEDPEEAEKN